MKSFSNLLSESRKRAGLTQKDLAKKVGIDHSYISKIERGLYKPPTRDKVLAITRALGISQNNERAYFLLAAGCANSEDLIGLSANRSQEETGEDISILSNGAFFFPDMTRVEVESIMEEIRHLLLDPQMSQKQRTEHIELVRSFLAWLAYHSGDENEKSRTK